MNPFTPSRVDGRSDRRIVFELAQDAEPDTMFDFSALEESLQEGVDHKITRARISRAVRDANKAILREKKRFLASVPGHGYRMIRADEHLPVAINRKERAEAQIKAGIDLLKNVHLEELSDTQRTLHVGQLMIMDGVYRLTQASEKRHARTDKVLEEIRKQQDEIAQRLVKLESEAA